MPVTTYDLAETVRVALESADLDAYQELLAPDVHWGAPDSPQPGCSNRNQVLSWYKRARDDGMTARVTEVVPGPECLLVGLEVSGREPSLRWQVLRVEDGLIVDITGFDDRAEAAARAGVGS